MPWRDQIERRQSERWPSSRQIRWKVRRGRRARCSSIVERSLDGMVLRTRACDTPPAGAVVRPVNEQGACRHGMREGLVLRTETVRGADESLVYIVILA
ncbi:MAG: hypothetical protein KDA21_07310 [Phycisphaerales bacterium]|nr:hypothetical protein [Phycisphaerales bacterium]